MPDPVITTTIRLPKPLYTELKVEAVRRSTHTGELLAEVIRFWLERNRSEAAA